MKIKILRKSWPIWIIFVSIYGVICGFSLERAAFARRVSDRILVVPELADADPSDLWECGNNFGKVRFDKMSDRPDRPSAYALTGGGWTRYARGIAGCRLISMYPSGPTPQIFRQGEISVKLFDSNISSVRAELSIFHEIYFVSIFNILKCKNSDCGYPEGSIFISSQGTTYNSVRPNIHAFKWHGKIWLSVTAYEMNGTILIPLTIESLRDGLSFCRNGVVVRIATKAPVGEPRSDRFWNNCKKI